MSSQRWSTTMSVRAMHCCFRRWLPALALFALSALSCHHDDSRGDPLPVAKPVARVLLVGADGLEWSVLRPLLARGRCPNLRALMEQGAFGRLATMTPTLSPILWTSLATGKLPKQHAIHGFTDLDLRQYTSAQRATRALWNIADRAGLASDVFGWWITWPAEEIRGLMVSGSSSSALVDANWKPALIPGAERQVWPVSKNAEVMAIAVEAGALSAVQQLAREKIFRGIRTEDLGSVEKMLVQQTLWSIQSDATYARIACAELTREKVPLALIYFGGTDVVGHRFWRYYEPTAFAWPGNPAIDELWSKEIAPGSAPLASILAGPEVARELATVIPNYYEWFDEQLGLLIAAAGQDATVIVCSDHGFHASSTDRPNTKFITGHHQDGPPGVMIAAGMGIARHGDVQRFLDAGQLDDLGNILTVAPTVLALLGLPPGADMAGRAYEPLLAGTARANAALAPVASWDVGFRAPSKVEIPKEMTKNFVDRFNKLGYAGMEGSDVREPVIVDPKGFTPDTHSPVRDEGQVPPKKP